MRRILLSLFFAAFCLISRAQLKAFGFTYTREARNYSETNYFITTVFPGSPAAKAGMSNEDMIIAINSVVVKDKSMEEFRQLLIPEIIELKLKRGIQEWNCLLTKELLNIDTVFRSGLTKLLLQADSNFTALKGAGKDEAFNYDCKVQLGKTYGATVLIKHVAVEMYDAVTTLYSGNSKEEAQSTFDSYEKQLFFYFGNTVNSKKYTDPNTPFPQQLYFSKKTGTISYEASRLNLAAYLNPKTSNYEVRLMIEGGVKPNCTFLNPDSTQITPEFKQMVQYMFFSFFNNKVEENLVGEVYSKDIESYKSKYCFSDASTCFLIKVFSKYHLTIEFQRLDSLKYNTLFDGLFTSISHSLTNQFVWYPYSDNLKMRMYSKNIVFAADIDHILPDKTHQLSLTAEYNKYSGRYTIRIEMN